MLGPIKKALAVLALATSTAAISTGIIPVSVAGIQSSQPANAFVAEAITVLQSSWGDIVAVAWTPWNLQVYMTNLSPQETQSVVNQYQSRASGVLFDRCVNKSSDMYYTGFRNGAMKTSNRW